MAKFRLHRGVHNENGETYYGGDEFYSDKDLLKHNRGTKRFEKLSEESAPVAVAKPGESETDSEKLDKLKTVVQLMAFAEERGIDLTGVELKADIIDTIRAALLTS